MSAFYVAMLKHRLDAALIPGYVAIQQIVLSHITKTVKSGKSCSKEINRLAAEELGKLCFIHMVMTSVLSAAITHRITMMTW